jgi:hypothetical protein
VEVDRRSSLSALCYLNLFPMSILRCVMVAMAVPVSVVGYCDEACYGCQADAKGKILMVLAGTHFVEFLVVVVFLFIVLCKRAAPFERALRLLRRWHVCRGRRETPPAQDSWHALCRRGCKFLRILCCGLMGGSEVAAQSSANGSSASCLLEISIVLADYFDHGGNELDVTPTDLIAGLIAVAASQRQKRKRLNSSIPGTFLTSATSLATGDLEEGLTECAVDETGMIEEDEDDGFIVSPHGTKRRRVVKVRRLQLRRGDDDEAFYTTTHRSRLLPGMLYWLCSSSLSRCLT